MPLLPSGFFCVENTLLKVVNCDKLPLQTSSIVLKWLMLQFTFDNIHFPSVEVNVFFKKKLHLFTGASLFLSKNNWILFKFIWTQNQVFLFVGRR